MKEKALRITNNRFIDTRFITMCHNMLHSINAYMQDWVAKYGKLLRLLCSTFFFTPPSYRFTLCG